MQFPTSTLPPVAFQRPGQFPKTAWQPAPQFPQSPVLAAQAPAQPAARVRLQAPEPERPAPPARLVMPSPEELGIVAAKPAPPVAAAEIDLNVAFARLRQLGALGLQIDRLTEGSYRARFVLPGQQTVEGTGPNEGAALATALERTQRKSAH